MARIANTERREYRSDLREQQAEATRQRILDATLRVMADGVASTSIPAVAREAGVSVPTVYRHFGTKDDLLAAVYPHTMRRAGLDQIVGPPSLEMLRTTVAEVFGRMDRLGLDELARAAMVGPGSTEVRRLSIPRRMDIGRELLRDAGAKLSDEDRERIARLMVVLISSSSLRMWREQLGVSVAQAADDVDWIVRAAIKAATNTGRRKNRP